MSTRDWPLFHRRPRESTSQEGQDYLAGMAAAANYAWANRAMMTFLTRRAFAKQFGKTAEELDMHLVYDVSHNIAKVRRRRGVLDLLGRCI